MGQFARYNLTEKFWEKYIFCEMFTKKRKSFF